VSPYQTVFYCTHNDLLSFILRHAVNSCTVGLHAVSDGLSAAAYSHKTVILTVASRKVPV